MNRRTFAAQIAKKTGHPANALEAILEAAIAVLAGELAKTGRFAWRGFGTFAVRAYAARQIHNPRTRKVITLHARKSVTFKPSMQLRAQLKAKPRRATARAPR